MDNRKDVRLNTGLSLLSASVAGLFLLIIIFLLQEAWPFLSNGIQNGQLLGSLSNQNWYPMEQQFGMAAMIGASLFITAVALFIALPLGLANAIYLQYYAAPLEARVMQMTLNLLAGIPSVVIGLWGLTTLVPLLTQWQPPGTSLLAASLILALMILPTIALTSASALAAIPKNLTDGSMALGLSRKSRILYVMLPAAKSGIFSGVLLAAARALGETMAVLMVEGNVVQMPSGLFEPVRSLTANIALEMSYAMGNHRASLYVSGLLLILLVWLLSWSAHRIKLQRFNVQNDG